MSGDKILETDDPFLCEQNYFEFHQPFFFNEDMSTSFSIHHLQKATRSQQQKALLMLH